jgi:hypothetical protein
MRHGLLVASVLGASLLAATPPARADDGKHLVYAEALGKAGLYGLGYEHAMTRRLSLGVAASYASIRGERIATVAPYLHATLLERGHHGLFGEVGAVLAHSRLPSPIDGWDGMSDTGTGGFGALGWQWTRGKLVLRLSGAVVVGEGGVGPMGGLAIGFRP